MLVLLIIFMVTAPLLSQGVDVELPQASAEPLESTDASGKPLEPIVLTITAAGVMSLNIGEQPDTPLTEKQLVAIVSSVLCNQPDTPVAVRADRKVNYGAVMQAMVLLQSAGAPRVGMVTEPDQDRDQ